MNVPPMPAIEIKGSDVEEELRHLIAVLRA